MTNKVILIGRVGRLEAATTRGGTPVLEMSLATTEKAYKDRPERTDWHRCFMFGTRAQAVGQFLKVGTLVYVEGKIQYDSWEKDGQKHYATKIILADIQLLGGKRDQAPAEDEAEMKKVKELAAAVSDAPLFTEEDIPF